MIYPPDCEKRNFTTAAESLRAHWLIFICDFLRNRSQRVKLDSSCFSEFINVPAGIAQANKIGPWLCLAMINDLSTTSALWKSAYDTTLAEVMPKSSASTLQNTVDGGLKWTDENVFCLDPTKCKEIIK